MQLQYIECAHTNLDASLRTSDPPHHQSIPALSALSAPNFPRGVFLIVSNSVPRYDGLR